MDFLVSVLQAESMVNEIKDAFKKNLPRLSWMDDETRQAARDKFVTRSIALELIEFLVMIPIALKLIVRILGCVTDCF